MILEALERYYHYLLKDPQTGIAPPGYSSTGVRFSLVLSDDGELVNIIPLFEVKLNGKKEINVPKQMLVPERVKRTRGIAANLLCDDVKYVLGISAKSLADSQIMRSHFIAFREKNLPVLEKADCPEARALSAFLRTWDPAKASTHPVVRPYLDDLLQGGNIVFQLMSSKRFIHDAEEIVTMLRQTGVENPVKMQCLITGTVAPISRVHSALKRIDGGNSAGVTLVTFNKPAFESYNRSNGQGINAPISETATFAYTTALNYLLSPQNPNPRIILGDTTVVYWAESSEPEYGKRFAFLVNPVEEKEETAYEEPQVRNTESEQLIGAALNKAAKIEAMRKEALDGLDRSTRFYLLGLAPNVGRVSVRFFHKTQFGDLIDKVLSHYEDLLIERESPNEPRFIPLWRLVNETVSKKATDKKPSPLMTGAMMRAILENLAYPAAWYYALITRIRADSDDPKANIKKINYIRAASIKAYLTRKYRSIDYPKIKEGLSMSLNEACTSQAYLLGRLFAVLEKAQQDAAGIPLNSTIKDSYFTAACAAPASVFPVLIRLSQHHIAKAEYGYISDTRIANILELLEVDQSPFPKQLSLDEQGVFILGYYHQKNFHYKKKENTQPSNNNDQQA